MAEPEFRWTQDVWTEGDESSPAASSFRSFPARHGWIVRGAILVLGLVVFELTTNAAISTAVSCLEFGRTDLQTAWWLLRADPDRRRGFVCSWCYLAWAFWRVGVVAMVVISSILTLGVLINESGMGPVAPPAHLAGAFALLAFSLTLASFLSFLVVLAALVNRTKVWLGPEPRRAKEQGTWPPLLTDRDRPGTNQAKVIVYLGCIFVMLPTFLVGTFVCFKSPLRDVPLAYMTILGLVLIAIIAVISTLGRRVLARSPGDCWPVAESTLVPSH